MSEQAAFVRRLSLRKIVLLKTGQDVARCQACQLCDIVIEKEMDIPIASLIQLINLNDEEVLTSKTLWSPSVLQHAKNACSRQFNLEAIILALRAEAVMRGVQPDHITPEEPQ